MSAINGEKLGGAAIPGIDEGESVAIALWWSFICDHAQAMELNPEELAGQQLEEPLSPKWDPG